MPKCLREPASLRLPSMLPRAVSTSPRGARMIYRIFSKLSLNTSSLNQLLCLSPHEIAHKVRAPTSLTSQHRVPEFQSFPLRKRSQNCPCYFTVLPSISSAIFALQPQVLVSRLSSRQQSRPSPTTEYFDTILVAKTPTSTLPFIYTFSTDSIVLRDIWSI